MPATAGDAWLSFQNGGQMSLADSAAPARQLSDDVAWVAELPGYGQSSPVTWDGRVYVTTVAGPNKETYYVSAYDLQDGSQLWQHEVKNASPRENSNYVSRAAPTPAADEHGLICFFEGGNLVALTHGGTLRWERNLAAEYGEVGARHGLAASIEQDEQSAYVWVERAEQPYVLSVDKESGETNWKAEGVGATSWASPRIVQVGDSRHLVLSAIGSLIGLDVQTGERLWELGDMTGNSTPTPIPLGNARFLIGATVGRGDSDSGRASASNGVVEIKQPDDGSWQADFVWRAKRATSSFGSPIAHNGLACFVNASGVLYALDLETGEEQFAERLAGSVWATPLGIGQQVFFFGKDGQVTVLNLSGTSHEITTWNSLPADPQANEGAEENAQSQSVLYGVSWCDDLMLFRRGDRLIAVQTTVEDR